MKIKNYYKHFKTILKHKYYVFQACNECGITWRGIKHDISKLSPAEFFEYANNYEEGKSPVNVAKEKYGYSKAWLHHRGRNAHHWTYWIDLDISDFKMKPLKMPYWDVVEMICDWIGASKAYSKERWTPDANWEWYQNNKNKMELHKDTRKLVEEMLCHLANLPFDSVCFMIKNNIWYQWYLK